MSKPNLDKNFSIKKKKYEAEIPQKEKKEDVVVKTGHLRFYFQNYYSIISLMNDLLLGFLYIVGALVYLFHGPEIVGNICYLIGAIFLFMRPVIRIIRHIYIYDEDEYQREVLQKENYNSAEGYQEEQKEEAEEKSDDTVGVGKKEEKKFEVEEREKTDENEA